MLGKNVTNVHTCTVLQLAGRAWQTPTHAANCHTDNPEARQSAKGDMMQRRLAFESTAAVDAQKHTVPY